MLKFKKEHQDAVIVIANYRGPITKDNITDPAVQAALKKHPKLWEESAALTQVPDKEAEPEAPKPTADEKAAARQASADLDAESKAGTAKLIAEDQASKSEDQGDAEATTTDADKVGTPVKSAVKQSGKGKA